MQQREVQCIQYISDDNKRKRLDSSNDLMYS